MLNFDQKARVFKDEELQLKFNNEGFVVLPFLNTSEISELNKLYQDNHPDNINGYYLSIFSKDTNYREHVNLEIQKRMLRNLENYFFDYKVHCGIFIVKGSDENSALKLHQDMTLVDENIYTAINIWIPLIDLNNENGAIEVLPRSHRLLKTYRGPSLPVIYDGIETSIYNIMQPIYLKAGEAIIFDQSIIHCSSANKSGSIRPVINTFITHCNATIQICYWDKSTQNKEVEIFEQEDDFMVNSQNFAHDIFSRPSIGKSIGFVPFDFPKITLELLQEEYGFVPDASVKIAPIKKNFFQKLFS